VIRPFRRTDRDQLTALVNAHIGAVVPGASVSVNALMSQLEREPGEAIVDPWVVERRTLVAVERDAVVAGALLLRHGDDERVGESYRGLTAIRWLVCRPDAPAAGARLVEACIESMDVRGADGSLPAPFVYGVPVVWPHIRTLYVDAGFVPSRTEVVLFAEIEELPDAPFTAERRVGPWTWTRLSAGEAYIDLETDFTAGGTLSRFAGWADIGNLVAPDDRTRVWLLGQAKGWLRLGGATKLVAYADPDGVGFYLANGFRELVRTERGWVRAPEVQPTSRAGEAGAT
jgi:hypothetical protein